MEQSILKTVDYEFECEPVSDEWVLRSVSVTANLDDAYSVGMNLVCKDMLAQPEALLGQRASLHVIRDSVRQSFGGFVMSVNPVGHDANKIMVDVTLKPAFAMLDLSRNTRIFENQSAVDILQEVLDEGLAPYGTSFDLGALTRGKEKREYCVQFDETDKQFVERLFQEEGISYYFQYDPDKKSEKLIAFDAAHQLLDVKNQDGSNRFPFGVRTAHIVKTGCVDSFLVSSNVVSSGVAGASWDWESASETPSDKSEEPNAVGDREVYRPLQRRQDTKELETRLDDEIKVLQAQKRLAKGTTEALGFDVGTRFELTEHPTKTYNDAYIISQLSIQGSCPDVTYGWESQEGGLNTALGEERFLNNFTCRPASTPIRPDKEHQKPRIYGTQTAKVTGAKDGEIHVDKHGRIKVQFCWDRRSSDDARCSCWVRVAQNWSGTGWGAQFIPRVGMEVLVSFIDGDPDRPVVTGTVYNGAHALPFACPKKRTQSGFRTRSSDGSEGFNEFRFDDLKDKEEIFLKAQKDWNIVVGDNKDEKVAGEVTQAYDKSQKLTIKENQTLEVGKDRCVTVDGKQTVHIKKDVSVTYDNALTHTVSGSQAKYVVSGTRAIQVSGRQSCDVKKGMSFGSSGGGASFEVKTSFDVTAKTLNITCSGMMIKISPTGIAVDAGANILTLSGTMVKIN